MPNILSTRYNMMVRQIFWIGIVWAIAGFLDSFFIWCISKAYYMTPNERYDFAFDILFTPAAYFVGGVVAGTLLIVVLRDKWNKKPFWIYFIYHSIIILFFYFCLSVLAYAVIFSHEMEQSYFHREVWQEAFLFLGSPPHFRNNLIIFILTAGTILWLRVNNRYGPGNMLASFFGKYHLPREEERIFMFLDMKSSTTIAEQLGHIRFYKLLDDFFRDVSDPILYAKGEVYQYVGDEIVVSWTLQNGLENANCINCFFQIRKALQDKASYYHQKYDGIFPEFKAGLHVGHVTTGEIGEIKRDLVHTGDVMNTTARIQEMCNRLNVKILLSKELLEKLILLPARLEVREMGYFSLRGKEEGVLLYTLEGRQYQKGA